MSEQARPCGRAMQVYLGRHHCCLHHDADYVCGESDRYCPKCVEPVLRAQRDEARELLRWFVDRCERGEVRSRETYRRFKMHLEGVTEEDIAETMPPRPEDQP